MASVAIIRKGKAQAHNLRLPDPDIITPERLAKAKALWAEYRYRAGFKRVATPFGTSPTDNQKYAKSKGPLIYGLSLAQSRLSGINVCLFSTPVCVRCCVAQNGNGGFPAIVRARIAKTRFLFEQPEHAAVLLADFLDKAQSKGASTGRTIGVRLNTFSDIDWQTVAPWLFVRYPKIKFYDYTKSWVRDAYFFSNYTLVYSVSERTSVNDIVDKLEEGKNVAVIFDTRPKAALPKAFIGYPVIDGDATDERWKDPKGCVIGLRSKGKMRTQGGNMVWKT